MPPSSPSTPGAVSQRISPSTGGPLGAEGSAQRDFDVCHIGFVLRAVLWVGGAVGLGLMFVARSPLDWLFQMSASTAVALPALLLWLALACHLKRFWVRWPHLGRQMAASVVGACCAGFGWLGGQFSRLEILASQPLVPSLLGGAAFGWAMVTWLRMRAGSLGPAMDAARLAQLQARIRPHFLFNTLNAALCLVRVDPARAEQVLEHLAELFRHTLDDERASVTLGEEVDLARRYLDIEQIRFGDRLRLQWQLDPTADSARLPPLLLQPLVENAVRHGVEPCPDGGTVCIQTAVRMGMARITITNSVVSASSPGHGIALHNVRERLYLMHDVAARFEVERSEAQYRVHMEVPL